MLARFCRHAGTGVGDLQDGDRAFAAAGDADLHRADMALRLAFQRLRRITHQVKQNAEQLVRIGVDG